VPLTTQDACAQLHRYAVVRPKHKIRRDRQFNVSLTSREFELLYARAAACRMRPVDYGRARLFNGSMEQQAAQSAAHLDPLFLAQLSRLGNNLNQLTRHLNAVGGSAPASLEPLLREIRSLISNAVGDGS
jgi:Bacterial mobilisation protein (MobC)